MAREIVLWQLSNSIFSEKARWALDYKRIPHRRRNLPPGIHSDLLRLLGRGGTVPVLDINGLQVRQSAAIIALLEQKFPDPPLFPQNEQDLSRALQLEEFFDEECGHEVRRVMLDESDDSVSKRRGLELEVTRLLTTFAE